MEFMLAWNDSYKIWLRGFGLSRSQFDLLYHATVLLGALVLSTLLYRLVKLLVAGIARLLLSRMSGPGLFKAMHSRRVFSNISYYVPLSLLRYIVTVSLNDAKFEAVVNDLYALVSLVLLSVTVASLLNAGVDYYQYRGRNRSMPIKGLVQFCQLLVFSATFVTCVSLIFDIPMVRLLGGLGAASALLILVFKDSIAGLIAGFQLSFNNMVKIGDWISMDKYGIDGEVVDINLASVKVRNWDKTISTIPAYSLIASDSIRNWQGVLEYGGRQIARAINIDVRSVCFCSEAQLDQYSRMAGLAGLLDAAKGDGGVPHTNLGLFRLYLEEYLLRAEGIGRQPAPVVRLLEPGANGVPLQLYCFSNTTDWLECERIQSDILDHALAMAPFFDLLVFQNPSGGDAAKGKQAAGNAFDPNAGVDYSPSSISMDGGGASSSNDQSSNGSDNN